LARWLGAHDATLVAATRDQLLRYLAVRVEGGARPRSTARQLSSIRRFYRDLVARGRRADDPSVRIEMPRLGRPLPKSLTEAEVERLLAAPPTDTPLGLRDRAMLEVLYSSGLRVSEL